MIKIHAIFFKTSKIKTKSFCSRENFSLTVFRLKQLLWIKCVPSRHGVLFQKWSRVRPKVVLFLLENFDFILDVVSFV